MSRQVRWLGGRVLHLRSEGGWFDTVLRKRPVKIDKTNILITNGSLMKSKVLQNAPLEAFCNTFDMH